MAIALAFQYSHLNVTKELHVLLSELQATRNDILVFPTYSPNYNIWHYLGLILPIGFHGNYCCFAGLCVPS
jgi:hypothetical protein